VEQKMLDKSGRDILYDSNVADACLAAFTVKKFQF
jgi:hypothetical protein